MSGTSQDDLEAWIAFQEAASRGAMLRCVSAEGFRHERAEFGQSVEAAPGSVLASRHRARWDPLPDYAYHWVRDAAIVMRLAPLLAAREPSSWRARMRDHVAFSLRIATRPGPRRNPLRAATAPEFQRFLRPDAELAALIGDRLLAEPRANIDCGVDAERWSRPQHDGPALRALSLIGSGLEGSGDGAALLALDLGYTLRQAAAACIGPWEEEGEVGRHAFTLMAQRAALESAGTVDAGDAAAALARIDDALGSLVDPGRGVLRGWDGGAVGTSDAAVILGALLAPPGTIAFGPCDPRILVTAVWLIDWSSRAFAINREGAPLIGRGPTDRFFGGNPWVPTTLGMAEFHFALATGILQTGTFPGGPLAARFWERCARGDPAVLAGERGRAASCLVAEGERYLAALSRYLPGDGRLPEQIDRETGRPASCPDLTWSHAAMLSALEARRAARSMLA